MALMLDEIAWSDPVLPEVKDPGWEKQARKTAGSFGAVYRHTAGSVWIRNALLRVDTEILPMRHLPTRLSMIGVFVVAQENACRYCYGSARAIMRLAGFSEAQISRIERDTWLTELDEKERAFIQFCRNLARSRPRPVRADADRLKALGYSPLAVAEMAFMIASSCFYNRVTTFLACPPETKLERFPDTLLGRLLMPISGPLFRLMLWRAGAKLRKPVPPVETEGVAFGPILAALEGLRHQAMLGEMLQGAFTSEVLPRATKALIFAVVARSLACTFCEGEARRILSECGLEPAEVERSLETLESPQMGPHSAQILSWARGTVHYETGAIQRSTRELGAQIGEAALLEAVGVASLANATVRLAMLLA